MSTVNNSDLLVVERDGNLYQIAYDQMSTLNDDDLLLVERGGVQYKVEAQYVSTGANGLIIPPVEVLTPINGAGITVFDQYEPLSSTITAVGEAGTIAKNTDDIQSVNSGLTIDVGFYDPTAKGTNNSGSVSLVTPSNADISNVTFESVSSGQVYDSSSNSSLPGYQPYVIVDMKSNVSGFSYTLTGGGMATVSLSVYSSTTGIAGSWGNKETFVMVNNSSETFNYGASGRYFLLVRNGNGDSTGTGLNDVPGYSYGLMPFIISSTFTLPTVLSFPTNTNFSGLSVGDVVQSEFSVLTKTHGPVGTSQSELTNDDLTIEARSNKHIEAQSTIVASSSNNYSETTVSAGHASSALGVGVGDSSTQITSGVGTYVVYRQNGAIIKYPGNQTLGTVASYGTDDVIGMAIDSTNVKFYKNGALQGTYAHGLSGDYYVSLMSINSSGPNPGTHLTANFGATAFTHTPPSGYAGLGNFTTITSIDAAATPPTVTVDGGTWDTSNQSQVWSSQVTDDSSPYVGSRAFDGDLSTACLNLNGVNVKWDARSYGLSGVVRVAYNTNQYPNGAVINDGVSLDTVQEGLAAPGVSWHNVGNITLGQMEFLGSGTYKGFYGIEVDGNILVDAVEDSQVWSDTSNWSSLNESGGGLTDLFDGVAGFAGAATSPSEFTLSSSIDVTDEVHLTVGPGSWNQTVSVTVKGATNVTKTKTIGSAADVDMTWSSAELGGTFNGLILNGSAAVAATAYLYDISIDGKVLVDEGVRDLGDRYISSSTPYEKSLTFTDDTQLANMVTPLEMVDANGNVVTPVSDTIANVSNNVLTLQGNTNLAYFQPGDEVQTGVEIVSVDQNAPSITVDGGEWLGADGTNSAKRISKSLRFNSADSAYLSRTPSSAGNRKTWTWSGWVKRSTLTSGQCLFMCEISFSEYASLMFNASDQLQSYLDDDGSSGYVTNATNAVFRDVSAWYHVVWAVDSTNVTASDRVKLYVNGVDQSYTGSNIPLNGSYPINSTTTHSTGIRLYNNADKLDAYLADVHFIDGQALAPTDFGEFDSNGVWQAKEYEGTYNAPETSGVINTIEITGNGPHGFHAIRVDGTILTGADYTNGTLGSWSSNISNGHKSFDGSLAGSNVSISNNGSAITWTATGGLSYSSKVEIYVGTVSPFYVNINGGGASSALTINSWNTIAEVPTAGVNGFHLDFSDNSSNAALGTDSSGNSNDWTVNNITSTANYYLESTTISTYAGGVAVFGNSKDNIFNGSNSTGTYLNTSNAYIQFEPLTPISFTTSVEVYTSSNGDQCQVDLGSGYGSATAVTRNVWTSVATGPGTLHGLRHGDSSGAPQLNAIRIDGTILSGTTPSDIDSLVDVPANYGDDTGAGGEVRGNYATLNPLKIFGGASMSNGNLDGTCSSSTQGLYGTIAMSSGKWYWEITNNSVGGMHGIANLACLLYTSPSPRDGLLSRMPSSA